MLAVLRPITFAIDVTNVEIVGLVSKLTASLPATAITPNVRSHAKEYDLIHL